MVPFCATSDGWLEQQTMDSLRAKVLHDLELADHLWSVVRLCPDCSGESGAAWWRSTANP